MTRTEVARLLTMRATFHGITVGEADVEAWYATIGDLPYQPAVVALVQHYTTTRDWLMPADLRPEPDLADLRFA